MSMSTEQDQSKASYYQSFTKQQVAPNWDAIVIGSGMGGMVCAAALAKTGKKVLVLEQHYVPGGFTHTFSRKGFSWDVGVHCVGQMKDYEMPGRVIKWLSDGKIKMIPLGPVYERFHFPNDFSIEYPDNREKFKSNLKAAFPEESTAIDEYFSLIKEVNKASKSFFLGRVIPRWMDRISTRVLPSRTKWWKLTTKEVLDKLTKNEKLKSVLTANWGYYGSTPTQSSFAIHALVTKHFWDGGYYPEGGSQVFAEHFLSVVKQAGGEALVRADVAEIIVKGGAVKGVKMKNGQEFFAPIVVSAAGAKLTASTLMPDSHKATAWTKELSGLQQSPPHICLYLGFEGDIAKAGATAANQWFMETWDMEDPYWDITKPDSVPPVLYVSFPSLKDPKHVPGPTSKHTGEAVTFVPWDAFKQWTNTRRGLRDPSYMAFKKDIEDRLVRHLKKHLPKLMDMVSYQELSTPLSTVHFTRAPMGAIYGLEATPRRFLSPELSTRTPIKGFYLTGGDVATLGVTGALVGGILTASAIEPSLIKTAFGRA